MVNSVSRSMELKRFITAAFLVFSCVALSSAQRPTAKSSDFNIEIFNLGRPNFILSIPEPPHRFSYIAHVNLKRIPDWKPSADVPSEASALRVQFWLEDGTPQLEVMAYLGKLPPNSRPSEWDQSATAVVKSGALQPDQLLTITELEKYGIVPFQVKISRAQPWSVGPPEVINKTQAIDVTAVSEARPQYILKIRNVSHKGIDAIHWYGTEKILPGRSGASTISGAPVIAPGAAFELRQNFGFRDQNIETGSAWQRQIVISAIVFDDGTFEGSIDKAAEMAANLAGDRLQLKHIKALITTIPLSDLHDPDRLKKLRINIDALSEAADPELVNELTTRFAAASDDMRNRRIKEEVVNGMRATKNHFGRELEKLEFRRMNSTDADFDRWLKDFLETLQNTGKN